MTHSLDNSGAARVASVLASDLAIRYRVVVICARRSGRNDYPVSSAVEIMYIPGLLDRERRYIQSMERYMKALKKAQNVYASVSLLYQMNRLNVNSRTGDKVICSERSNPRMDEDGNRFEELQNIYEKADHVVFQSSVVQNLFNKEVRRHSSILPNPVGVSCIRKQVVRH